MPIARSIASTPTGARSRAGTTVARMTVAVATTAGALGLLAGVAAAHVDADPLAIQAGTTATVGFGVEHGCATSPTIELKIKFPDGFTNLKPVDKSGWTTAVDGNVVTFSGGELDTKTKDDFSVSVTAPAASTEAEIPIVQTCKVGAINWVDVAKPGEKEPEHPAATLKVTAGVPTADDLKPETVATTNSSSKAPWIIGALAAVAAAAGVAFFAARRNKSASTTTASETTSTTTTKRS